MKFPSEVVIYTDGASRGNPGPASYGFVIQSPDGKILHEQGKRLGHQTNNYAEYMALIEALKVCVHGGVQTVTVRADSQLMIRQLAGIYKVKSDVIIPLFKEARELLKKISKAHYEHIPREENKEADRLANEALDGLI